MSRYTYLKSITANPHQFVIDLFAFRRGKLQASKLSALTARGWGDTWKAIETTFRQLDQLMSEFARIDSLRIDDPRRLVYLEHLGEAGFPTETAEIKTWLAAAYPNRSNLHQKPINRPADYYDREPIQLFGLGWIELPPDCRVGSFTKAATKAHSSPGEAVEELKTHGLPGGDLLLKCLWDGRWQVFQRRQVTGRMGTPMGSYAKKAPLGTGRLFLQ